MFDIYKLDIVMIHETMCIGQRALDFFSSFLKDWSFSTVDVVGQSRGLITRWNPHFVSISSIVLNLAIVMHLYSKELGKSLRMINVYSPYGERKSFWEVMVDGYLNDTNVILGGDLNLTINMREIWREVARRDPLGDLFSQLFGICI
jgi:hypothetical protein